VLPEQAKSRATKAWFVALRIGGIYACFGVAWVLFSDAIVTSTLDALTWLQAAQHYKGLVYVLLTTVGLMVLVRRGYQRLWLANAQSKAHELQVQDLFLFHPQPMWLYDRSSLAFLKVNHAAVAQYGFSEDEFLQMTLRDIKLPEDVPQVEALNKRPPGQYRDVGTVRHRRKSGELFFVHITAHSVPYQGSVATMVMAADVNDQVLAKKEIERQEARFRQLFQSLGEVLWLASVDGSKVLYVSQAFEHVYGRPASDLVENPALWLNAVLPEDAAHALASNNQLWALGHSSCEYRIRRPDGTVRWISDRKKIIDVGGGEAQLMGGIAEDITALKERDAARATTKVELENMVALRTAELERVNVELEAFTRTAAHDLKSPLNGIAGMSYLIKSRFGQALGTDGMDMVGQIEASAMHMATLVNDLLALSRVGATELNHTVVDLVPVAQEVMRDFQRQEPRREVKFLAPPQLLLDCDAGLLTSLLTNLLSNAWKFTAKTKDARIALTTQTTADRVTVRLEDNGDGFDSTKADNLFKPFQRFHSAAEFKGTGIGLVTCQRIVHRHGGDIRITSAHGVGTTVEFTMPCGVRAPVPLAFG